MKWYQVEYRSNRERDLSVKDPAPVTSFHVEADDAREAIGKADAIMQHCYGEASPAGLERVHETPAIA